MATTRSQTRSQHLHLNNSANADLQEQEEVEASLSYTAIMDREAGSPNHQSAYHAPNPALFPTRSSTSISTHGIIPPCSPVARTGGGSGGGRGPPGGGGGGGNDDNNDDSNHGNNDAAIPPQGPGGNPTTMPAQELLQHLNGTLVNLGQGIRHLRPNEVKPHKPTSVVLFLQTPYRHLR
ncbi:hypothetical protein M378DRAFT_18017 [Amanita muscaria Koide BX008]|uniref:Uncharacterized protein n=1 Tax=Amanita muscaria (strain Koide BX008) TaxID=946122 RepID=A0A0C2RYE4_AMAMK|nr:hypothetical protein M378DRAFT_18017 [Amanita muscaria Koide BX008]